MRRTLHLPGDVLAGTCIYAIVHLAGAGEFPDIRSVEADLMVPNMINELPSAGRRVRFITPGWEGTGVYHALYLPADWEVKGNWPVIVEWPGNGGYRDTNRDECTGRPEGCSLGYGITQGRGAIWICAPFVDSAGKGIAEKWWGDAPTYDPAPTLAYLRATVQDLCDRFCGDPGRVVLAGFSRGSIAVNRLGLHNEEIAALWNGFICFSHYDGVRHWPFPGSDRAAAASRLTRLNGRPQFICGESDTIEATRRYLAGHRGSFTFQNTGFRNHNDAWVLRPSPARTRLRAWWHSVSRAGP